jgi:hypothetical protein
MLKLLVQLLSYIRQPEMSEQLFAGTFSNQHLFKGNTYHDYR